MFQYLDYLVYRSKQMPPMPSVKPVEKPFDPERLRLLEEAADRVEATMKVLPKKARASYVKQFAMLTVEIAKLRAKAPKSFTASVVTP